MLQSVYPKPPRWTWFQARPQGAEIDWRNPITQNLYGAWLLGDAGPPRNLVNRAFAAGSVWSNFGHGAFSASGTPLATHEFHGPAAEWVGAGGGASTQGIDLSSPSAFAIERTEPLTIMAFLTLNVLRSGGSLNYTIWANEGDNGPGFTGIRYQINWFSPKASQLFTLASTEPTNVLQVDDFDTIDLNNDAHVLGVKYDGSSLAAGCRLYHDGAIVTPEVDSDTLSASIVPATPIPAIGKRTMGGSADQVFKGKIAMIFLWRGRALSNSEMIEVDTNYQQMFLVPSARTWSIPLGGPGADQIWPAIEQQMSGGGDMSGKRWV